MNTLKEVRELFRRVGFQHNVVLGSLELGTGHLIIDYDMDYRGRANIIIGRDVIDDDQNVERLAEDVMSRLAERLTPGMKLRNITFVQECRRAKEKMEGSTEAV